MMAEHNPTGARAVELLTNRSFMTAGGTETYLAFQQELPLRGFCAFEIFDNDNALARLESDYLYPIVSAVCENGHCLLLDALLWRAHPSHLIPTLDAARAEAAAWLDRFKGFRANSSRKSHEELDNSTQLDRGDPEALARTIAAMRRAYALNIIGGCCGTDVEHITAIAATAA